MEQNQNQQPPVFTQPQDQQPAPQYQPRVTARPMMEPVEAMKTCFNKFLNFKGRARRSEYWWFVLFTFIVSWIFSVLGAFHMAFSVIGMVIGFVLCIPQMAAMTRRLHDTNRSGWWALAIFICMLVVYGAFAVMLAPHASALMAEGDDMAMAMIFVDAIQEMPAAMSVATIASIITIILFIITLIFTVKDSHWTENKYGPSPKYQ